MTDLSQIFPPPPAAPSIKPDFEVAFILCPNFTLVPFAGFIDSLRHASDEADFGRQIYCRWSVVGPDLSPIRASCGVSVTPTNTFDSLGNVDYLVVAGGQLPMCMDVPEETLSVLRTAYNTGTKIIGLCTGSFIIARAGLLNGKRCAVHSEHRKQFLSLFPETHPEIDKIFLRDRGVITCPGGTSALDLAFSIIESHSGKSRAVKALTSLLVDNRRAEHHMPHRPYRHLSSCGNWRVEQAVALMERNISNPHTIEALAERIGATDRELHRAFQKIARNSPSAIYRDMRLSHGHWLLTNTSRTVTHIAMECGFSDAAHFCRWFKKKYGEPPKRLRSQRQTEPSS